MRAGSKGLSLLEVLLTLSLISIALALTSSLLASYAKSTRAVQRSNTALTALEVLSGSINSELKGAARIVSPSSPSVASTLILRRVDPSVPDRLTYIVPGVGSPPIPQWTPYDYPDTAATDDFIAQVSYSLNGDSLERAVKLALSTSYEPATGLVSQVRSFEVELFPDESLETRIEVDTNTSTKTFSSRVFRRVRP